MRVASLPPKTKRTRENKMNGKIISEKIAAGYTFTVRMCPNQKFDKYVMVFDLRDPTNDHFYSTTKYQAIKYLSAEQLGAMKAFEEIQDILKLKGDHFGRYLDGLKTLEKLCAENDIYRMIRDAGKKMITLKFAK